MVKTSAASAFETCMTKAAFASKLACLQLDRFTRDVSLTMSVEHGARKIAHARTIIFMFVLMSHLHVL